MTVILSVRGLSKRFGGNEAVSNVSFDVSAGEMVALIGPNGAGKTTCFKMLNGQLRPDSGTVRLGGQEITGLPPRRVWRMGVGRTFQITCTFTSMTVRENVQMALLSYNHRLLRFWRPAADAYVDEAMLLLKQIGMADQAERGCGELAYGDVKRVELAVALANQPKLLLMDEPTAGMAPAERVALMQLTADLARDRNVAILFTEHDMDVVFTHANRAIVVNRGKLIAEGTPNEVREDRQVQEVYLGSGAMLGAH